jgi:hypothetical protein
VFQLLLFLHIGAAIVAFGPTFTFPLIGARGGREPQHGNFALRLNELIVTRMVLPFAATMPITGLGIVNVAGIDFFHAAWLDLAIVLYAAAVTLSVGVLLPNTRRLIELTTMPPAAAGGPAAPPAGDGRPAGPPPEFFARVRRSQLGGLLSGILIVAILALMVIRPG